MKFKHGTRRRALEYEKDWAERWKENKTFEKSVENRSADDAYVFYDGPPFITGVPHHGTLLSSIVKDAVPRYWTMKGKRVERVWGWDCHGLPAENFVEKQLNIIDRRQIVTTVDAKPPLDKDGNELPTITLEKYITKARESMVANSESWESYIDRIGRWVDFKGAYRTMDKDFMESVWWAFKQLHNAGKIYEGEKVLMYDTRFATPVSKAEVTMDNDAYQTVTDPSLYVKFKLKKGRVILLHGKDKSSKDVWYPWVGEVAQRLGYGFVSPDLPKTHEPELNEWLEVLRELSPAEDDIIIGHSRGGMAALRYLERNNTKVRGIVLVAANNPTIEDGRADSFYLDGQYDFDTIRTRASQFAVLHSRDDRWVPFESGEINAEGLGVSLYATEGKNHFGKTTDGVEQLEVSELEEILRQMASDYDPASILAWTTTPWTLPANLMLAVSADLTYCEVLVGGERLIVAEEALERVMKDAKNKPLEYEVVRKFSGSELVGKSYEPLDTGSSWPENDAIHKIYAADFVSHESGTGIVHIAPAYGEDDFELAKANSVAAFHVIDDNGYYFDTNYKGLEVWENNKRIAKDLMEKGIAWRIEYIRHEYPFNPRSRQRIMYRAIPSWFFDVQGQKLLMLEQNENINWFPEHLKHGRFQKNIEQAPDWNLSRDRFWATAMPVWKGDKGTVKVIGSYAELKELSGVGLEDYHRPWVDDITFEIDGEKFTRIDKVLDCWFESGSMPFAQLHYPFENQEKFEKNYPADFIVEYVGQVRAWFYYVHAVNTSLAEIGAFGKDSTGDVGATEICFVRHGQTDANVVMANGGELAGEDNAPLNDTGKSQVKETAQNLKSETFDVILTSPYKRAVETAEIINKEFRLPVVVLDELRERDGGGIDEKTWHEAFNFDSQVPFNGESATEFFERVYGVIEKIKQDYAGKKVLVVSHGGVQHGFYAYFNNLEWKGNLRIDGMRNADFRTYTFKQDTEKNAFKNVITTGVVAGNDGRKMSKSLGNFTDPNELMDKFSADSLRFLLLSSPLLKGEDFALHDKDVGDVARKLSMVWNMYDFFTMYAEVDGWEFDASKPFAMNPDDLTNPLDKWIVSRVHQLNEIVTENMDAYDIPSSMEPILPLLDDASNWYVRRSRRRFWKSEDDGDKNDAYRTLHYVLLKLSVILAPFTPFLAEELYHNLTGDEESVHLKDWATDYTADQVVLADMARTRDLINAGLGLRMKKDENQDSIKVRQPLQFASYAGEKLDEYYERIIAEELNVKEVRHIENLPEYLAEYDTTSGAIDETTWVEVCKEITPELRREGLMREVIRHVQAARKQAGLNVDDRIVLSLASEDEELMDSLDEFQKAIAEETLTDRYVNVQDGYSTTAKVEGAELRISLKKA